LPTALIAVKHQNLSANGLAAALRKAEPPIVARVSDDKLLVDLRTVAIEDEMYLIEALVQTLK